MVDLKKTLGFLSRFDHWQLGLILGAIVWAAGWLGASFSEPIVEIEVTGESLPIASGLLGQAIEVPLTSVLNPESSQGSVARLATSLRGPMAGLVAEFHDWRVIQMDTGNGSWLNLASTLDYSRLARRLDAELIIPVNARGVSQFFSWPSAQNPFQTTDLIMLGEMAADRVTYSRLVTVNSQNRGIAYSGEIDQHLAEIMSRIDWRTENGTVRAVLPAAGDQRLPNVEYWEIGNEPNFPLGGIAYSPEEFAQRYLVVSRAIGDANQTTEKWGATPLKIGPALMVTAEDDPNHARNYLRALVEAGASVDFVSYHPYTRLFGGWYQDQGGWHTYGFPDQPEEFDAEHLDKLRNNLSKIFEQHYKLLSQLNLDEFGIREWMASEWNPSGWQSSYHLAWRGKSMVQALAMIETIFRFSQLGYTQAHYHTLLGDGEIANPSPVWLAAGALKQSLGTELLASLPNTQETEVCWRVYVTETSETDQIHIWGLNWCAEALRMNITLTGHPSLERITNYYFVDRTTVTADSLIDTTAQTSSGTGFGANQLQWITSGAQVMLDLPANGWQVITLTAVKDMNFGWMLP